MRPQSCKSKGRLFQQHIRDRILAVFPDLEKDDVRSTSMGCGGADIQLSPAAAKLFPFGVECKHTVTFRIGMWRQALMHTEGSGRYPVLFLKTNRKPPLAVTGNWVVDTLFGKTELVSKAREGGIKSTKVFTPTSLYSIIDSNSGSDFLLHIGEDTESLLVMTCDTFFELVAAKHILDKETPYEEEPDNSTNVDIQESQQMPTEATTKAKKPAAEKPAKVAKVAKPATEAKAKPAAAKKTAKATTDAPAKVKTAKVAAEKKPAKVK